MALQHTEATGVRRDPVQIVAALDALRRGDPMVRARDAATQLGMSEAELVAARCDGRDVVRLDGRWDRLLRDMPAVGPVMVLTRNRHAVHEKVGAFDRVSIGPEGGVVLDEKIDLRVFLGRWRHGFAVREQVRSGLRDSLQFFDAAGTAIHKIYRREETDATAWEALVGGHRASEQTAGMVVEPAGTPTPDRPDTEIDDVALRAGWLALQDTHDFFGLLRDLGVGRLQALRLAGRDLASPAVGNAVQRALETAAAEALPVMVFVGNPGMIQIHGGPVHKTMRTGAWFNVLDADFNLHLHEPGIDTAWVVRKPTRDGIVTAIELFDADGMQILWMFGLRKPGQPERAGWRDLAESLVMPG